MNGGWVEHDEACLDYDSIINNLLLGTSFLSSEFGMKTNIGWQLSPFGHSSTNARLYAGMDFDAVFVSRVFGHPTQFVWAPEGSEKGVFTQMLDHTWMEETLPELQDFISFYSVGFNRSPERPQTGKSAKVLIDYATR